jgi:putative ABC transport system substrate-binding protein
VNNRRTLLALVGAAALAAPLASFAQTRAKPWRIGFLSSESPASYRSRVEALKSGLRDFGYVEGKNLVIEFRWALGKNELLPQLAAELVRLNVDAIVTHGSLPTKAATNRNLDDSGHLCDNRRHRGDGHRSKPCTPWRQRHRLGVLL